MIEALWSIEFVSNLCVQGFGVVVLETGKILGGDGSMIYKGSYRVNRGKVFAEIHVAKCIDVPGISSIAGLDSFSLMAEGEVDTKMMVFDAYVEEDPRLMISFRLTRRGELPNPC